jgi:hypothetical protein
MSGRLPARMTGSCRNGAEKDGGRVVHLIGRKSWETATSSISMVSAACGSKPKRNSAGWEAMTAATPVTCEKCLQVAALADAETPSVTVEAGILPPPRPEKTRWPFSSMAVGESFLVPDGMRKKVASCAQYKKREHGLTFSVRTMPDGAVRCFRIK